MRRLDELIRAFPSEVDGWKSKNQTANVSDIPDNLTRSERANLWHYLARVDGKGRKKQHQSGSVREGEKTSNLTVPRRSRRGDKDFRW